MDHAHLLQTGLGDKNISIIETADTEDLYFDLLEAFPKLRSGGGYEVMKPSDRSNRSLDVIPCPPSGYTIAYYTSKILPVRQTCTLDHYKKV